MLQYAELTTVNIEIIRCCLDCKISSQSERKRSKNEFILCDSAFRSLCRVLRSYVGARGVMEICQLLQALGGGMRTSE